MTGRVLPVGDSLFCNAVPASSDEDGEIGTETMWISSIRHRFSFFTIVMRGVVTSGALLCGIHERLIDFQFRETMFPTYLIDSFNHLFLNLIDGR